MRVSMRQGHAPLGRTLINKGARIDALTMLGDTPLHDAAGYGQLAFTKMLIRRGADPLIRSNKGQTPLENALARGYPACVSQLEAVEAKFKAHRAAEQAAHEARLAKRQVPTLGSLDGPPAPAVETPTDGDRPEMEACATIADGDGQLPTAGVSEAPAAEETPVASTGTPRRRRFPPAPKASPHTGSASQTASARGTPKTSPRSRSPRPNPTPKGASAPTPID